MISKIKCLLGLHDWLYNDCRIEIGTIRQCKSCQREEQQSSVFDQWHGNHTWIQRMQAER